MLAAYPPGARYRRHLDSYEARRMRWDWSISPWGFRREHGRPVLALVGGPQGYFDHELREGIRGAELASAEAKRTECLGVSQGVNREATLALRRISVLRDTVWYV